MRNLSSQDGQTMPEYAVVLSVISVAIIVTIGLLSGAIGDSLQAMADLL